MEIVSGDLIALSHKGKFYGTNHRTDLPIHESQEVLSSIKLCPKSDKEASFYDTCIFKIVLTGCDSQESLTYGSIVYLKSFPLDYYLVGNSTKGISLHCCLDDEFSCLAAQWIITSRYRIRRDGDVVSHNDTAILINLKLKSPFGYASLADNSGPCAQQLHLLSMGQKNFNYFGQYIRLFHVEFQSFVTCSSSDSTVAAPAAMSFGNTSRSFHPTSYALQPDMKKSILKEKRGLDVWQVISYEDNILYGHMKEGATVMIRHLYYGHFLSLVPLQGDSCPERPESYKYILESKPSTATCFTVNSASRTIVSNDLLESNTVYFVHCETSLFVSASAESIGMCDVTLVATSDSSIANAWKLSVVSLNEVQEIIFLRRFPPLLTATHSALQLHVQPLQPNCPLYRHFRKGVETLLTWAQGLCDNTSFLVDGEYEPRTLRNNSSNNSLPTAVDSQNAQLSSMIAWLPGNVQDSMNDTKYVAHRCNNNGSPAPTMKELSVRRSALLNEVGILDYLLRFVHVAFLCESMSDSPVDTVTPPHAIQQIGSRYVRPGSADIFSAAAGGALPAEVLVSCRLIYALVVVCIEQHTSIGRRLFLTQDLVPNLISQKLLGWMSPVEVIVSAAVGDYFDLDSLACILPRQTIHSVLTRMLALIQAKKIDAAQPVIRLLIHLCSIEGTIGGYFQDVVVHALAHIAQSESRPSCAAQLTSEGAGCRANHTIFEWPLFRSRYDLNTDFWQINLDCTYSDWLLRLDDQDERGLAASTASRAARTAFAHYFKCNHEGDERATSSVEIVADAEHCVELLQDLSLSGPILWSQVELLTGCDEDYFVHWWCTQLAMILDFNFTDSSKLFEMKSAVHDNAQQTKFRQWCLATAEQLLKISSPGYDPCTGCFRSHRDEDIDCGRTVDSIDCVNVEEGPIIGDCERREEDGCEAAVAGFFTSLYRPSDAVVGLADHEDEPNTLYLTLDVLCEREQSGCDDWLDWSQALMGSPYSQWLCLCVSLLSCMSAGNHRLGQELAHNVLPARLLVSLLAACGDKFELKHNLAELLLHAYVDHDWALPDSMATDEDSPFFFTGVYDESITGNSRRSVGCEDAHVTLSPESGASPSASSSATPTANFIFRQFLSEQNALSIMSGCGTRSEMQYHTTFFKILCALLRRGYFPYRLSGFPMANSPSPETSGSCCTAFVIATSCRSLVQSLSTSHDSIGSTVWKDVVCTQSFLCKTVENCLNRHRQENASQALSLSSWASPLESRRYCMTVLLALEVTLQIDRIQAAEQCWRDVVSRCDEASTSSFFPTCPLSLFRTVKSDSMIEWVDSYVLRRADTDVDISNAILIVMRNSSAAVQAYGQALLLAHHSQRQKILDHLHKVRVVPTLQEADLCCKIRALTDLLAANLGVVITHHQTSARLADVAFENVCTSFIALTDLLGQLADFQQSQLSRTNMPTSAPLFSSSFLRSSARERASAPTSAAILRLEDQHLFIGDSDPLCTVMTFSSRLEIAIARDCVTSLIAAFGSYINHAGCWGDKLAQERELLEHLCHFITLLGHSSVAVTNLAFDHLKKFVLLHFMSSCEVALLLRCFLRHRCVLATADVAVLLQFISVCDNPNISLTDVQRLQLLAAIVDALYARLQEADWAQLDAILTRNMDEAQSTMGVRPVSREWLIHCFWMVRTIEVVMLRKSMNAIFKFRCRVMIVAVVQQEDLPLDLVSLLLKVYFQLDGHLSKEIEDRMISGVDVLHSFQLIRSYAHRLHDNCNSSRFLSTVSTHCLDLLYIITKQWLVRNCSMQEGTANLSTFESFHRKVMSLISVEQSVAPTADPPELYEFLKVCRRSIAIVLSKRTSRDLLNAHQCLSLAAAICTLGKCLLHQNGALMSKMKVTVVDQYVYLMSSVRVTLEHWDPATLHSLGPQYTQLTACLKQLRFVMLKLRSWKTAATEVKRRSEVFQQLVDSKRAALCTHDIAPGAGAGAALSGRNRHAGTSLADIRSVYFKNSPVFIALGNQVHHIASEQTNCVAVTRSSTGLCKERSSLRNLFSSLSRVSKPSQEFDLLVAMFCEMLEHKVDDIRASTAATMKRRLQLVDTEVRRLRLKQNALCFAGALRMVSNIIANIDHTGADNFPSAMLALQLGYRLMDSRNVCSQTEVVRDMYKSPDADGDAEGHEWQLSKMAVGLRMLLRRCTAHVKMHHLETRPGRENVDMQVIYSAFVFCRNLCAGHNLDAQRSLYVQNPSSGLVPIATTNVNITHELANSVSALVAILKGSLRYISHPSFCTALAPLAWESISDSRRLRFLSWNHCDINFVDLSELLCVITAGLQCLQEATHGPCRQNQKSAAPALKDIAVLLELVGSLQLNVTSSTITKYGFQHVVNWRGGDPRHLYKTLDRERDRATAFDSHRPPTADAASVGVTDVDRLADASLRFADRSSSAKGSTKGVISGINVASLVSLAEQAELSCLRFLLALLEGGDDNIFAQVERALDKAIFFRSLDSAFRRVLVADQGIAYEVALATTAEALVSREVRVNASARVKSTFVSYLTLASYLATANKRTTSVQASTESFRFLLEEWADQCSRSGHDTATVLASVEVIGIDNVIERVYFPIPDFVKKYWSYPEVQLAKDDVMWTVNRDSPEQKVAHFFTLIEGLIRVMRRQDRLSSALTPALHGILFGGKLMFGQSLLSLLLPSQRVSFLLTTVILNGYFGYFSYYLNYVPPTVEISFTLRSRVAAMIILSIQCLNLSLAGLLLMRHALNSRAGDHVSVDRSRTNSKGKFSWRAYCTTPKAFRNFVFVLTDCWWKLLMLSCSSLGFFWASGFYCICLLDIVPQLQFMAFLMSAIARNFKGLCMTLLLAIILLFLFATVSILFFPNQYGFAGRSGCAENLGQCFKFHIDYGIGNQPSWTGGAAINPVISGWNEATLAGNVLAGITATGYNLVYIVLINFMLQAVITGLILDTFSSMRQRSEAVRQDMADTCFICSLSRDEFDQAGISFNKHIKEEHNAWAYLWFKLYLELGDPVEHSGPEHHSQALMADKQSFVQLLPIKRSLSMQRVREASKTG